MRLLLAHPTYNGNFYDCIETSLHNTQYDATISQFQNTRDVRGVILQMISQNSGCYVWDSIIQKA